MATGPKTSWGGSRANSGRKRLTLSAAAVTRMLETAEVWADKKGKDIDDVLFSFIYDETAPIMARIACIKIVKDFTMARPEEGGETDRELGPVVYLPELRPDPANVVQIAG